MIFNSAMPREARRAYEQAHQQRGGKRNITAGRKKQTTEHYRLTPEYQGYLRDERAYREQRKNSRRADIQALNAKTYLHTRATPKATARRLDIARMKNTADKVRIARARSPERQRAKLQRELNTTCYVILKERGLV